jgi:hypothetical protein
MSINLHIERLILDGLPVSHAQGPILSAALKRELGRLLANGGLDRSLQPGGAWRSVPVNTLQLTTSKPPQLGRQIAQAIYQGIGREELATSSTSERRRTYANKN